MFVEFLDIFIIKFVYFNESQLISNKMDVSEIIKSINHICLLISFFIFLIIKFLKYLISKEKLKIKKSESLFSSIN